MAQTKPRIAVFFGGETESYDLSQETGYWVCNYLPRSAYDITPVRVQPDGTWQVPLGGLPRQGPVDRILTMLFRSVRALPPAQALERLLRQPLAAMLTVVRGRGGDDGALVTLGRTLHIPAAGSPSATCQQTFDKHVCADRTVAVASTPLQHFFRANTPEDTIAAHVQAHLPFPMFVKPVSEEASIGVEEITDSDALMPAIRRAKTKGDLLIQERAPGSELNITLYQDARGTTHMLPPTVVVPQRAAFYDQLAKRQPGRVLLHTPDTASNPLLWEAETIARDVYDQLGCEGYASFDLMAGDRGVELLEVNTIPTLTRLTPLKHQLKAAGMHPTAFVDTLVAHTLQRGY